MRKRLSVDPKLTVASLIVERQALHVRCLVCGLDRYLSPFEAAGAYGAGVHIQEIAGLLKGRCGAERCQVAASPLIHSPDRMEIKRKQAP